MASEPKEREHSKRDALPDHLQAAFAQEEETGFRLATRLRFSALAIFAVWITIENGFPEALFYYFFLAAFAVLGLVPLQLRNRGRYRSWHRYLFPLLDCFLVVFTILAPNPFERTNFPLPMDLRFGNEMYLFVFLVVAVFSYSPRVVLWTGASAALAWSLGVLWVLSLPQTLAEPAAETWAALDSAGQLATIMDPQRVFYGPWGRLVMILLVVSGGLAAAVHRSRRLVLREADAERGRANLSRYFSANLVEKLAKSDEPIGTSRSQNAAILFADIVGFTALSEHGTPADVIGLLREFHVRVEEAVFAHDGTLDKYIGDGVMVSFGTPVSGEHDATNALRSARALLASVDAWSNERVGAGKSPVKIGIGLHYGPVIAGDVGGNQRLEYTVIGDTVNVASRVERLTRHFKAPLVVSDDLLAAVRAEGQSEPCDIEGLVELSPQQLRGREETLKVFALLAGSDPES